MITINKKDVTGTSATSLADAVSYRMNARREGKSFVLTNGCFDLVHAGHVFSLTQASGFGDYLWVAMNSDASVRLLKGDHRPVLPEEERAYLLNSLSCVSGVTLFDGQRLTEEILALQPDVYVKSGDYTEETIDQEERKALLSVGASIKFVPFLEGLSTSSLIDKILTLPQTGKK